MLRKRLIFTLIYNDGFFTQSRNFRLQKVGDISWLEKNYGFKVRDLYLVQIHPENNNYKKIKVPFLEEEIKNIIL